MIEDPTKEEWNQLVQLAQQEKDAVINGLDAEPDLDIIVDDPVEGSDESVWRDARALEDAKRAEERFVEKEKKRKVTEEAKKAKQAKKKARAEKRRLASSGIRRSKEGGRRFHGN